MNTSTRQLALWLFLISVVVTAAYGWPTYQQIVVPGGAMLGWDNASSTWRPMQITDEGKLVTDAAITVGSITVTAGEVPDSFLNTETIVVTTPAVITAVANRQTFSTWNNGTCTMYLEVGVATPTSGAGVPIPPGGYISFDVADSEDVSVSCSAGSTNARSMQAGY